MSLKELIKELEKSNKVADKVGLPYKYYVVVSDFTKSFCIKSVKGLKTLEDYYIPKVADMLINNELKKEEDYYYNIYVTVKEYNILAERFEIRIGVE